MKTSVPQHTQGLPITWVSCSVLLPDFAKSKGLWLLAPELLQKMQPAPKEKASFAPFGVATWKTQQGDRDVWASLPGRLFDFVET